MRILRMKLLTKKVEAADLLGNSVTVLTESEQTYAARSSGFSLELRQLDGRGATENAPEIWTNAPLEQLQKAVGVRIASNDFRIVDIYGNLRGSWSLIKLERWKS